MNIENAQNPKWINSDHTLIDLEIEHPRHGLIQFTASPTDTEKSGREIFERAANGEFGTVADYGFRVQQNIASAQSRAQDTQFQTLMKSLGLKTATIQAETAATVAGYQAQGEIARAKAQASGGGSSTGLSLPMLALIGFGIYMVSKK